jgi:hypothetical protein
MPHGYQNTLSVVINDRDFDIVARNVILLLLALLIEDRDKAASCMLHVWYSAFIQKSHLDLLTTHIRPLIEDVNVKIANKAANRIFGKTWKFGSQSLRLELTRDDWVSLLRYFEVPQDLSPARAQRIRSSVTMANERKDYRERKMISQPPAHRLCMEKFLEDGILLPFGHDRDKFDAPNP